MINDENTTSISKDCFFFPAAKKKSSSKVGVGKNEMSKARKKLCDEVWGEMETIVNTLHDELQGNLFQQLLTFIQGRNLQATGITSQVKISTAVLITGVNMPDHKSLFTSLSNNISNDVSPYVVSLQSRQSINMKTLMKSFGTQLAASLKNDDERSEFEKRGAMVTMSAIEEWYLKNVVDGEARSSKSSSSKSSPSKRRKVAAASNQSSTKQPIVVIFEDFEAFPRKLLHDFILTSSFHTSKLELVFIFGVSTSWEEISQRLLSHSSMVHLDIVKFQAPAPSRHLSFIFDKILLTDEFPFKLSGKCLQLALDVFLRYDFSISNFIRSLKFCVLEHFRKQPASVICQMTVEKAASLVNSMKLEDLKMFTSLNSVQKYFASMDQSKAKEIKSCRKLLKKELVTLVHAIYGYHDNHFVTMKCLNVMTRHLPNLPMGKQIREIFCACHRKPLGDLAQFREAFLYLRVSSRDQLTKYFQTCINIIDDHVEHVGTSPTQDPHSPENYRTELVRLLATLSSDDSDLDYYDSDEYEEAEKAVEEMSKVKYTYQLQQRLREKRAAKTTKKRKTKFEKLREEALLRSRDFFEHNLRPPVNMELYEVFYFDSPQTMKERLISSPRLNIETALSDPYYYIKVKELDNCAYISSSFPDVSIAYKLHLESGSLINLYDWLKAFHVIVTSDYSGDDDANDDIDETTQARFVQAVSELQLMGFIKPTKKKIDHMQRLTWS